MNSKWQKTKPPHETIVEVLHLEQIKRVRAYRTNQTSGLDIHWGRCVDGSKVPFTQWRLPTTRQSYTPPSDDEWAALSEINKLRAAREYVQFRRCLSAKMARWVLDKFKQE